MSEVLTGWFAYLLANASWHMVGQLSSILAMTAILIAFVRAHLNPDNSFNLMDMFATDGRIGGSKMRLNGLWLALMWCLIYLTLNDKLTEWYVAAMLTAFVYDRQKARESEVK